MSHKPTLQKGRQQVAKSELSTLVVEEAVFDHIHLPLDDDSKHGLKEITFYLGDKKRTLTIEQLRELLGTK